MDDPAALRGLLEASSDADNPTPGELRDLLARARRVAVVGMSRHPEKAARRVPAYLAARGYDVVPVNPSATRILGRRAYASLDDVPGPVDLVLVFRPSDQAGRVVEQALARPEAPAIWLQTGIRADPEASRARAAGRLVVQDLCAY
ncbi:MAG TPA: CoA-binding protein, partial [Longimicrobiales bacterium]|nr:CoA-binding protein [Longimicrobiales bacterium]